jgi:16S rRNA (uracil1498-N3)-methyltransferase
MPHPPRFYVSQKLSGKNVVTLDAEESHHAASVLRLQKGDALEVFDGEGRCFGARVGDLRQGTLSVILEKKRDSEELPVQITLAVSAIASDRMEFLIQKVCELGAAEIWPVTTERSVVRLSPDRWAKKIVRWKKIVRESCKQCGRSKLPDIRDFRTFEALLGTLSVFDLVLLPTLGAETRELFSVLKNSRASRVLVMIGPEGDFSPREIREALRLGARAVTLGPLVLRTETAAVALVSVLSFFFRELQK